MPSIAAKSNGLWVVRGHLFLSYAADTKCISLDTLQEVQVDQWGFISETSIGVGRIEDGYFQVTRSEIRYRNTVVIFPSMATAASIKGHIVYMSLSNSEVFRVDLVGINQSRVTLEAEITALHAADRVYAGLSNSQIVILHDSLLGAPLFRLDLNSVLTHCIPNQILCTLLSTLSDVIYIGMREGNIVCLSSECRIIDSYVLGSEPVHLCCVGNQVLAGSTSGCVMEARAQQVHKIPVDLRNVKFLSEIEDTDSFAMGKEDVSLCSLAKTMDYHMTFRTIKKIPVTAKRIHSIGTLALLLVAGQPESVQVLDTVLATQSLWDTIEELKLTPEAEYCCIGSCAQAESFYVAGALNTSGLLHICSFFSMIVTSTTHFRLPIRAVAVYSDLLIVGSGPSIFLMRGISELQPESLSVIRVLDTVVHIQVVDLSVKDDELLVVQQTQGVLIYSIVDNVLELKSRTRLGSAVLSSAVFFKDTVICYGKEGEVLVLDRTSELAVVRVTQTAKFTIREGGRKLLVSKLEDRVFVLTLCGSVFELKSVPETYRELQEQVLTALPTPMQSDFKKLRDPVNIVSVIQIDLDLLKQHKARVSEVDIQSL